MVKEEVAVKAKGRADPKGRGGRGGRGGPGRGELTFRCSFLFRSHSKCPQWHAQIRRELMS